MSKKKKRTVTQKPMIGLLIGVVLLMGTMIFGGIWVARQSNSGAGTTLRDSDTAFSLPTHVGQPASKFTAIGADGQPYTFSPGDGRPKAIVFYMGFQ